MWYSRGCAALRGAELDTRTPGRAPMRSCESVWSSSATLITKLEFWIICKSKAGSMYLVCLSPRSARQPSLVCAYTRTTAGGVVVPIPPHKVTYRNVCRHILTTDTTLKAVVMDRGWPRRDNDAGDRPLARLRSRLCAAWPCVTATQGGG